MMQSRSRLIYSFFLLALVFQSEWVHAARFRQVSNRFFNRRPTFTRFRSTQPFLVRRDLNQNFNRFGQFNNAQFNVARNNNNNGFVNNSNVEKVQGFSSLLKFGNEIIERNSFGETRRLIIDANGDLRGASEATTVRQLREFYLLNRDKFKGNALATVDRFLARNGGLSNGKFIVDLKNIVIPDGAAPVPPGRELEFALASLNYLLNTIQTNVKLKIPPQKIRADGTVELDLSPFFSGEGLAILKAADPTAQCTGKVRLDRLITFAMDPKNYYKLINAPNTRAELSNDIGVQEDETRTSGNKIIVGTSAEGAFESGVTRNNRVIEVQSARRVPGRSCYRSLDVTDRNAPGEQSASRDVTQKGILFTHDAEEWLCLGRNGMMQGFLFNAAGNRIERAPAEIATGAEGTIGPAIAAVATCLDCHASGFIAGGAQRNDKTKLYTDFVDPRGGRRPAVLDQPTIFRDSFGRTLRHGDFFTSNALYRQRAAIDSNTFKQAQVDTGSFFSVKDGEPYPVIPQMIRKFDSALTPKDAARTLGISEQSAQALIGKSIDRNNFESRFCNLRVGNGAALNEGQTRDLLRREASDFNTGGRTHIR